MKKNNSRIYLSAPHMGGEEIYYIHDAFQKNWIAPLGENVDGFENDLERYTGRKHAAAVTSGTSALHLALRLCGVGSGDQVICQSLTFAASANPILYQGASPIFVDSEPDTWNMDPYLLEQAIFDCIKNKAKPKAIIVVHLYGMPAKMHRILSIADKYNIPVIEDAAEALGSSIGNQKCGSFGALSVLSFNGNKIITTSGGGALLSDNQQWIDKARFWATQARDDAPYYQHSELGYNYRMSNILAGVGRGQMKVIDRRVSARRKNHHDYFEQLNGSWLDGDMTVNNLHFPGYSGNGIYFLKEPKAFFSNRWLTTVLVNPEETGGITNSDIRLALEKENIETRPLWKPMHQQPLYESATVYNQGVADFLFRYGLCLPSGSNLESKQKQRIINAIKSVISSKRIVV